MWNLNICWKLAPLFWESCKIRQRSQIEVLESMPFLALINWSRILQFCQSMYIYHISKYSTHRFIIFGSQKTPVIACFWGNIGEVIRAIARIFMKVEFCGTKSWKIKCLKEVNLSNWNKFSCFVNWNWNFYAKIEENVSGQENRNTKCTAPWDEKLRSKSQCKKGCGECFNFQGTLFIFLGRIY